MPNPSADFPSSLHSAVDISAYTGSTLGSTAVTHTDVHGKIEQEVRATQAKVGTGSSTPPADGVVLVATGNGTSLWKPLTKLLMQASNGTYYELVVSNDGRLQTTVTDYDPGAPPVEPPPGVTGTPFGLLLAITSEIST